MRDIIMKTAADKIQTYGLRKFTMDEIAVELKISKKTIYRYFSSKDDIIIQYFDEIIETDKNDIIQSVKKDSTLVDKLNSIIYSYHKYRLPVKVLDEAYKFYYEEWEKIQELKRFKVELIEAIIKEGMEAGCIRADINLNIISSILENISNLLLDYKFLSENDLTLKDGIKQVMTILLHGILKENEA